MKNRIWAQRSLLLASLALSSMAQLGATRALLGSHVAMAAVAGPAPFTHPNTETEFYQGSNGLKLYNAPVGYPRQGAYLRDTSVPLQLSATASTTAPLKPAALPFDVQLASTSATTTLTGTAPLASLTNEAGVHLGLTLADVGGQQPAVVPGHATDGYTIAYPSVGTAGAGTDVALHQTISGLDVRFVLHGANQPGPFDLAVTPDPRTHLVQGASGIITVEQTIPLFRPDGTQYGTNEEVEYVLARPIARDAGGDAVSQGTSGPARLTLAMSGGTAQQIAVSIDPTWLQDAKRVFPITVDIPVLTALAAGKSGIFGTLNSCAADAPAPLARVVVGAQGACTYHGLAYFDVSHILAQTPIQSAILNIYTPNQTTDTGVAIYPNQPPADPLHARPPTAWEPASWNSAPAPAAGVAGIGQSGSDGHWQQWDVTTLVRQWVNGGWEANTGLTLIGSGPPVLFSTPLGTGDDQASLAPFLNIAFAPQAAAPAIPPATTTQPSAQGGVSPLYGIGDNPGGIFGISQGIARDGGAPVGDCPSGVLTCANGTTAYNISQFLHGKYIRFYSYLSCGSNDSPGPSWWNNNGNRNTNPSGGQHTYDLMVNAYNDGLVPVVLFNIKGCQPSTTSWQNQLQDFVNNLSSRAGMPNPLPQTYFEIMNEPYIEMGSVWTSYYPPVYAAAAQKLPAAIQGYNTNHGTIRGRILTAGVEAPSANLSTCPSANNINTIKTAINQAEQVVGAQFLGVAVHPYTYTTPYNGYSSPQTWVNYGQDHATGNACLQLDQMINLWTGSSFFYGMPLVFSETNVSSSGTADTNQEGEYIADFMTWLRDFGPSGPSTTSPYTDGANQPVRALWYTGVDYTYQCNGSICTDTHGLYNTSGGEKAMTIVSNIWNPGSAGGLYCPRNSILAQTNPNLSALYAQATLTACY